MKKLMMILLLTIFTVTIGGGYRSTKKSTWYKTCNEVDELYEKHYNRNECVHIQNYIHEMKDGKYIANIKYSDEDENQYIEVPVSFIKHILNHLEKSIENGWVKYIFWADLNHGHLCMEREYWDKKYIGHTDPTHEYLTRMLEEDQDKMVILYHAAEHFYYDDPACLEPIKTRNVLGWFDGRPIELTYPKDDDPEKIREANTAGDPDGYDRKWFIGVTASKYGLFAIYPNGKEIRLDITFQVNDVYDSVKCNKGESDIPVFP